MIVRYTLLIFVLALLYSSTAFSQLTYRNVAPETGLDLFHLNGEVCDSVLSSGSAWADFDNDGDVDLYVTNSGGRNQLYQNEGDDNGDGWPDFKDVSERAGVDDPTGIGHSAVFIDYDNDGDQDLYVTNWGANIMFQNQLIETGLPEFLDVTATTGLQNGGRAITTAWADFDQDGLLDVYLAKHRYCPDDARSQDHLFKNNGDGTFNDVSSWFCPEEAPCEQLLGIAFSAGWFDFDNDADLDLYVVNEHFLGGVDYYPNVMWRNDGRDTTNGQTIFTDISIESGLDFEEKPMGLGLADYDNDGWMDIAFSNTGPNVLIRNMGNGTFEDMSEFAGITRANVPGGHQSVTWGTVFFDYNNDGLQDLYFVAGPIHNQPVDQPNAMFRNNGDGTFDDVSAPTGLDDPLRGRAASIADFNDDGFVDVFVGNIYQEPKLFVNQSISQGNTHNWLTFTFEGTISNRDAIGTRIWLETGVGELQMREINSGPTYGGGDYRAAFFGLGTTNSVSAFVRWPSGIVEDIGAIYSLNRTIHLVEPTEAAPQIVNGLVLSSSVGDEQLNYQMTFQNTTASNQPTDIWVIAHGPGGFDVEMLNSHKNLSGYSGTTKNAVFQFPPVAPDGAYDITVYNGAYPHVIEDSVSQTYLMMQSAPLPNDGIASLTGEQPDRFSLSQNYPNPFNPTTSIQYQLPVTADVKLAVYDVNGKHLKTLVEAPQQAASFYEVVWDGKNAAGEQVASGVYLYRLTVSSSTGSDFVQTRKMMLTR